MSTPTIPKRDEVAKTFQHSTAAEDWAKSEPRVVVFSVVKPGEPDGDGKGVDETVDYTMPAKPNAGLALKYLKMARTVNPDVAMSWLIELAVGEEGYDALTDELAGDSDPVTTLNRIVGKIQSIAMGGLEAPKA